MKLYYKLLCLFGLHSYFMKVERIPNVSIITTLKCSKCNIERCREIDLESGKTYCYSIKNKKLI